MADPGHRNPAFVMTLPFDQDLVQRYITDRVLFRTQRRWEWFAEAQRLCSGLGTLTYLPTEIRHLIWNLLFECRDTLSCDGSWEYDHTCGPIFDLKAYYFGFGRRGFPGFNGLEGLRLVSSAVKGESDEAFLASRTFRFNQAENLAGFLNQLTPASAERLRSLEIGICTLYYMESWMDPVMRLPPSLREVRFRVYPVLFGWYDTDRGIESLKALGRIVERAVQSSPTAKISIASTNREPLSSKCQDAADAILERLQRQKEYQKRLSSGVAGTRLSIEAEHFEGHDTIRFPSRASQKDSHSHL